MADQRDFFEHLVYRTVDRRRFTQQSPVMPDVWIKYGMNPGEQQDLLMVPNWHHTPADLARAIRQRVRDDEVDEARAASRIQEDAGPIGVAHNQNAVVARLWFDQLVRAVLPLSEWWQQSIAGLREPGSEDRLVAALEDPDAMVEGLVRRWAAPPTGVADADDWLTPELAWMARLVGLIAWAGSADGRDRLAGADNDDERVDELEDAEKNRPEDVARAFVDLLGGVEPVVYGQEHPLYTANLNRTTLDALHDSVAAVKADASSRLFQVTGSGIRWAIIDSGIDATHVAFRARGKDGTPKAEPFTERKSRRSSKSGGAFTNETRIVATYDFLRIRSLLSTSPEDVDDLVKSFPSLANEEMKDRLTEFLVGYEGGVIDWYRLEPLLRVPHTPDGYRPPVNRHGTHVAGILGADWRAADADAGLAAPGEDIHGVCPGIEIYDLRVLDDQGTGDEFAIMSAMQFVRALNSQRDFVAIHGVNLSLSIPHDVANYACGRTPVCEEAERLVGSGVLVVAAAGNSGRARYLTPSNKIDDGFRTVSITDPGNAAAVITVGSTHRRDAHAYGVSYFSSRGPTGDGRLKPDLVAPGEKIRSTIPGNRSEVLDGTSMAAPHVSGAAALIMARHVEMIGQPRRVKETLCSTATDLGRERYFQGAGLLDVLRALQAL